MSTDLDPDSDNGAELAAMLTEFDPRSIPVRFSNLKHIGRTPLHYLHAAQHGIARTGALEHGNAVDAMVYGTGEVIAYPGAVRRGKEWEAFRSSHPEAIILTKAEMSRADTSARALARHPRAVELRDGSRQRQLAWTMAGRACSGRPDTFTAERLVDLKTCQDSSPEQFRWTVLRYAYHAQLAWYRNALLECGLANPQHCYLVAIESRPPHPVTVFRLTDKTLELGTRIWRLWWERLRVCEESNEWPGYAQTDVDLELEDMAAEGFTLRIDGEDVEV